jgi:iron complex outermembrane recepter protein
MSSEQQVCWREHIKHSAVTMCGATLLVVTGAVMAQTSAPATATPASKSALMVNGESTIKFDLPAEPLAETLRAIGQQSGRSVQFNASELQGLRAPAIRGRYAPEAALQKAISGTKATMNSTSGGGWIVYVPKGLDVITVTANVDEAETGFQATRSDTTTRSGSDLMDIPGSMTVITSAVMESQQAKEILDVLQDVSGVQTTGQSQGLPNITIRGLPVTSLTNGLTNPFATNANMAGVERIEVLKGPQAILSGGDSLGGAVNIVTKKPSADPVADLSFQEGTFGDKTATADFSDALAADGQLSGRVIGSWTRAATSDAHFDGRYENYFMPEIRWKDNSTDFIFGVSYDKESDPLPRYTFALTNSILPVPTMRLGARDNGNAVTTKSVFYSMEHKFAPWLTFVSRFHRDLANEDLNIWLALFPVDIPSTTMMFSPSNSDSRYGITSTDNYLRFTFHTGPVQHVLSTGVNTTMSNYTSYYYYPPDNYAVPVYQPQQFDFPNVTRNAADLYSIFFVDSKQDGVYAQDLMTWGDFHALLNLRRSYYVGGPTTGNFVQSDQVDVYPANSAYKTTPSAGLVYNVSPNVSVYGSYTEGFVPNFTTTPTCDASASAPLPLSTRNEEVGFKFASSSGLFSVTSSAFNLLERNVLEYNGALNCNVNVKGQLARGVEMDAQGQLAKGWNLVANLTHSTYGNVGEPGMLVPEEPRNHFMLWTTYDFQGGWLKGFGVGGGVTAYSWSYSSQTPGSPNIPGGARVDLSAYYKYQNHWLFTLGVKNVFNRTLYNVTLTPIYIPVNPGRTAMFTVKYNFL